MANERRSAVGRGGRSASGASLARSGTLAVNGLSQLVLRSCTSVRLTHRHDFNQVVLPLAGCLHIETRSGSSDVTNVNVAVISSDVEHAFYARQDNKLVVIDAYGDMPMWDLARRQVVFGLDAGMRSLLDFARNSPPWLYEDEGFRTNLGNLFLYALSGLLGGGEDREPLALMRSVEFVRMHFGERISVEDIADAGNVSLASLYRLFRQWCGTSPAKYLTRLRLEHAQILLVSGKRSIAQVAVDCGFSEQSALTRAMVRELGVSPASCRLPRNTAH